MDRVSREESEEWDMEESEKLALSRGSPFKLTHYRISHASCTVGSCSICGFMVSFQGLGRFA
jgi:hypothetical protein